MDGLAFCFSVCLLVMGGDTLTHMVWWVVTCTLSSVTTCTTVHNPLKYICFFFFYLSGVSRAAGIIWTQICPPLLAQLWLWRVVPHFFLVLSRWHSLHNMLYSLMASQLNTTSLSLCHLHRCIHCLHCATWVTIHTHSCIHTYLQTHTNTCVVMREIEVRLNRRKQSEWPQQLNWLI